MIQKHNKFENGFGLVVVLAVIAIIAAAGAAGMIVFQRSAKNTPQHAPSTSGGSSTSASSNDNRPVYPPAEPNVTYSGNNAVYTSKSGRFVLTFPKTWAVRSVGCSDGLILLGADNQSVGACGSENFGQMAFVWEPVRTECGVTPAYYTDISTQSVVVSGVSGTKTTATAKADAGVPAGTKIEQYCYIKGGVMYTASYNQNASHPDVLAEFESVMTNGLVFN